MTDTVERAELKVHAALAESTRHEDGVHLLERTDPALLDALGIDVLNLDARAGVDAGVNQRFRERLVRLGEIDVFADDRDVDRRAGRLPRDPAK